MSNDRVHLYLPVIHPPLPLAIDSVGYNPEQETIHREDGYPYFHWLHTTEGEGELTVGGQTYTLYPNSGMLLFPEVAHHYHAKTARWTTCYVTFYGSQARGMLEALGIGQVCFIRWDEQSGIDKWFNRMLLNIQHAADMTGIDSSSDLYRFLMLLKKYGSLNDRSSVSHNMNKIKPLLAWLDAHYGNPDIGLAEMANRQGISVRSVNLLFQSALGMSAYSYLIDLRIRKAKQLIIQQREWTIKRIAEHTGYRDVSHFTATFRKKVGASPQRYRQLLT